MDRLGDSSNPDHGPALDEPRDSRISVKVTNAFTGEAILDAAQLRPDDQVATIVRAVSGKMQGRPFKLFHEGRELHPHERVTACGLTQGSECTAVLIPVAAGVLQI